MTTYAQTAPPGTRFQVAVRNRNDWVFQCDTEHELFDWLNKVRKRRHVFGSISLVIYDNGGT